LLKKAAENGDRAIVANISSGLGSSTNVTSRFALSHTGQEGENYNIVYGMSKVRNSLRVNSNVLIFFFSKDIWTGI
jgi:hypothetical protein